MLTLLYLNNNLIIKVVQSFKIISMIKQYNISMPQNFSVLTWNFNNLIAYT